MGLTEAEISSVWRVVSAVLLFGQMQFDTERRTEQAVLKSDQRECVCPYVVYLSVVPIPPLLTMQRPRS